MGLTMSQKIIHNHLVSGKLKKEEEIGIQIDQTLTQDSTGTMTYLQLEAMNIDEVKTKRSVAYVDHNLLQVGFENADDHKYLQTVTNRYGIYFSKPGNGICHQVHLERFSVPGQTLIGSDSHTPTCGAVGMLAIGAGGLDVAKAMAGVPYYFKMPKMVNIKLSGTLQPGCSAKDIILEVLRRLTVKGGVGKILEYTGSGVCNLSIPERGTITNMGAELGATTSIFPSDATTKEFLKAQTRLEDYHELSSDEDAHYDEVYEINLDELKPLIACPHSPDAVRTVEEVGTIKVDQVAIGSCTNGSYQDLMKVATILKGKTVHPDVSLVISPGSKQVLTMLAKNGALADILASGARLLESGCGPCIGMGQSPATNAISLRTFNRNFYGRCGTLSANVYLCSPETAAYSALAGVLINPMNEKLGISQPDSFEINDLSIISPNKQGDIKRGPNIKPFPLNEPLSAYLTKKVLIKVGDHITTDHIMPSNAKLLPYRSNIPYLSQYCFQTVDETFATRAMSEKGGFIIAGLNYGQGSSREHAALVPLYLGIKGVIAKSFARIHRSNLINSGILPLEFVEDKDYDQMNQNDVLELKDLTHLVTQAQPLVMVYNVTQNRYIKTRLLLSKRERKMILAGGAINLIKQERGE
ncbi:aconitate hydratase [Turicibacter sanguinis]|uniref:aconitate hydratase n=1 Tax=Turicibacter sanguinis TaxID=154288 RepID=UPI0032EB572E